MQAHSFFLADIITLSDQAPIARGRIREVYAFPGRSDLLIKVMSIRARNKKRVLSKRIAWRIFKDAQYRSALKEIECELKAALKIGEQIRHTPLPRMLGVVQTDRGWGIVVEKISGEDGGLARQLLGICQKMEMTAAMLVQLNQFVARVYDLQIVGRDLHARNIVYGLRGSEPGFFLIDGYGERNLIPLRTLSRRLNNRSLNRQFKSIGERTGLIWDRSQKTFDLP